MKSCSIANTTQTLVFLHGFLGFPDDWKLVIDYLPKSFNCVPLDLYPFCIQPSLELVAEKIYTHLKTHHLLPCHLIGYSLGGRISITLSEFPGFLSLTILSSHIGILSEEEKRVRLESDLNWIHILNTEELSSFLEKWTSLPLFSQNQKEIFKYRSYNLAILKNILLNLSVAKHPQYKIPDHTLFIYGQNDAKYYTLYSRYLSEHKVREIKDAYHRVHVENPEAVAHLILEHVTL